METKHEIFGIGFDNEPIDVYDKFDVLFEDEELMLASKETFHHQDDDGLEFDYKYLINVVHCYGIMYYTLELVVLPQSCCKEYIDSVMDYVGVDSIDDINLYDMESTGGSTITFGTYSEACEDDDDYEWNMDVLNNIASVFETMDRLRGFYIDRTWNYIGTTGWDTLYHCIKNEKLFKIW